MSRFSGKCDLYDHIMMEKTYDKGSYYDSDELECFKIFKEKTGGKLYQYRQVRVSTINQEELAEKCPKFSYTKNKIKTPDRRTKSGYREVTAYTYTYYDTTYTDLKSLNEAGGVTISVEIPFENIFDLIPYYPYLIAVSVCNSEKETIYISKESFVDAELQRYLDWSVSNSMNNYYHKELQQHYVELIENYGLEKLK